jgi:hypothetical protein
VLMDFVNVCQIFVFKVGHYKINEIQLFNKSAAKVAQPGQKLMTFVMKCKQQTLPVDTAFGSHNDARLSHITDVISISTMLDLVCHV